MAVVLVDTSVWIELFAKPQRLALEEFADPDDVVTTLPIVQEVLQGIRDERAYGIAREAMLALPILESPLSVGVFVEAAQLYRAARRSGITVRSGVDCLIAACAIRHSATVLHCDRDFDGLARIAPLAATNIAARARRR